MRRHAVLWEGRACLSILSVRYASTTSKTSRKLPGHKAQQSMLPFKPMLLTQFGTLADIVEGTQNNAKRRTIPNNASDSLVISGSPIGHMSQTPSSSSSSSLLSQYHPPYFLSPKLDGVRCISADVTALSAHKRSWDDGQEATAAPTIGAFAHHKAAPFSCYSRFGSPLPTFPHIEQELSVLRHLSGDSGLCLDGELYLHDDQAMLELEDTSSPASAKTSSSSSSSQGINGGEMSYVKLPQSVKALVSKRLNKKSSDSHINFTHGAGYRRTKELLGRLQFNPNLVHELSWEGKSPMAPQTTPTTHFKCPTHPRYCVFDVISYIPPSHPTCPLMAHVMVATGINSLATLQCDPYRTSFISRARTLVFLFTLLQAYTVLLAAKGGDGDASLRNIASSKALSNNRPSVMAYPAPVIKRLLSDYSFSGKDGSGLFPSPSRQAPSLPLAPLHFRGGSFVKLVPYTCITNLSDAPNKVLPRYLSHRFEGAVVRTALNVYLTAPDKTAGSKRVGRSKGDTHSESGKSALSVRSPTAVKLLPYFDKEYLVLRIAMERPMVNGRIKAMLTSVLCTTDCGKPFKVNVSHLPEAERAELCKALVGSQGHMVNTYRKAVNVDQSVIGSYVTLQFAATNKNQIPLNAVVKGVRGKDKATFI